MYLRGRGKLPLGRGQSLEKIRREGLRVEIVVAEESGGRGSSILGDQGRRKIL